MTQFHKSIHRTARSEDHQERSNYPHYETFRDGEIARVTRRSLRGIPCDHQMSLVMRKAVKPGDDQGKGTSVDEREGTRLIPPKERESDPSDSGRIPRENQKPSISPMDTLRTPFQSCCQLISNKRREPQKVLVNWCPGTTRGSHISITINLPRPNQTQITPHLLLFLLL